MNSDDGNANEAFQFFGGRRTADSFAQINLSVGIHEVMLIFHEGGGGSSVEWFAAPGNRTVFSQKYVQPVGASGVTGTRSFLTAGERDYIEIHDNSASLGEM